MKLFNQQLILTIFALMLISCGSGEDDNSSLIKSPASNSSATNSISGKAIDGYLSGSTVCLDLDDDGVCSSDSEPTNKTDNTGSYTLTLSTNHKAHSNFNKSSVIVYGGTDIDSNQSFAGKLKAYNNGNSTIHITPTTTLIDSMALPYADAKAKIADTFGIDEATIESDPIATNNATLFAKAVAVQRAVDLLVNADDSTDSNSTKANKIMTAIAAGLKSKTGSQSIDTIINSIDKTGLNSKTQNALKLAAQLAIATKDTYKDVTDRSDYAKISDTYFQDAKQVIIDNGLTEQITDAEIKAFEERVQQKEHSDNIKATIKGTVKDSDGKAYANRTVFLRDNVAIGNGNGGFYTTQTDDSGNYSFLIFSKGNYTLWLKLITDEQQTAPSPGGKNIVFNDTAEITTAGSVTTMDFVVKKPTQSVGTCPETEAKAIFCGKVFADKNGNNEFDTGEQVFKNADVYVQDLDNGGFYGPTTDENGDYNFAAYEVGKFKIWINAHVSYQSNVVLPVESDKSHYPFYEFYLDAGDNKKIDFVIHDKGVIPVTVSGRLYYDDDSSGDYNAGDRPIYKRQVFLVPDNGGAPIYRLTDNDGKYSFDIVPSSSSKINWKLKPSLKGDVLNSPALSRSYYDLSAVNNNTSQDFVFKGIPPSGSNVVLKGKIYKDNNDNGTYDTGDVVAPGVTVFLRNATDADAGNGGFYTTTSDSNGDYSFIDTTGGVYKIWFALPDGKKETTSSCNDNDGVLPDDWSADNACGGIVFHTRTYLRGSTPTMDFGYTNK